MEKPPITGPIRVHIELGDQTEAYDESQVCDAIRDGDLLVTDSGTVAIMVSAWPTLIDIELAKETDGNLVFHTLEAVEGLKQSKDEAYGWGDFDGGRYKQSYLAWLRWHVIEQCGAQAHEILLEEPAYEEWGANHRWPDE